MAYLVSLPMGLCFSPLFCLQHKNIYAHSRLKVGLPILHGGVERHHTYFNLRDNLTLELALILLSPAFQSGEKDHGIGPHRERTGGGTSQK